VKVETEFKLRRIISVFGFCEHTNEHSGL